MQVDTASLSSRDADSQSTASEISGRDRLVEATLNCLAELGSKGATIRRIAEEADVTAGLVRHHFQSKDALFREAYQAINKSAQIRMQQVVNQQDKAPDLLLRDTIRAFFPEDLQDRKLMRIHIAFWGLVLTDPAIAEVQQETYSATLELFTTVLRPLVTDPEQRQEMAVGLISLCDGLWLECCLNPDRMTAAKAVDIVTDFATARLAVMAR
ncbi:TetR/AcrR family transcriptional regulator [Rhodovibrionaceae bacterium A322]